MEWLTTLLKTFSRPFQWWVVVAPWERGIRIRLGKVAAELAPGIHFRIPFLDRVHVQSVRLRTIWQSDQAVSSRDGHTLTLALAIDFSIVDLRQMFDSLSSPAHTLRFRAAAACAAYASKRDKKDIDATALEAEIDAELASFGCGLGQIRARVVTFSFARAYRLIGMNYDYSTAGLHHDYEREPGGTS